MPQASSASLSTTNSSLLERLRQNDPTLTKLKLVQNYNDVASDFDEFLECLRNNTIVSYVLLERHFVRSLKKPQWIALIQAVGQMTNLDELEIWSVRVPLKELCEAFKDSTKLTRLGFGFVTLEGSLDASALCGHASLKTFYLSDFRFVEEEEASLDSLCQALSTCPNLRFLEVFQYQQEHPPVSAEGLAALMESPCLQHLTLRRMGLTAALTSGLANKLVDNLQLRVLNLNENKLGNEGSHALGHALTVNHSLQELDLRKNQLSANGCFVLAQQLSNNEGLERLNLACNPLEDHGAEGLASLLQVHPSLKTLELHRTLLTDMGTGKLVDALRDNESLVNLDLSFNSITEITYVAAAEALKVNHSLKSINLQVNKKMRVSACEALLAMVKENTVLERVSTLMRVRFEPQDYHELEDVLHQMNLYLRLNHAGRNHLLQGNATVKEWGTSLLAVQDDLNGLYYLTHANPAMICQPFLDQQPSVAVE
ncbi:NLR family, CARD domain containing 3 [Seminavis robusta]|uniref:NLR family, CARD domain containing 3 n=1 Tax=Seminavis robusta TaxID=568900 RepID=A0A9N8H237_9STRA|nr:NLR family, CARD domain containing 3 [Seminavis robusta]|eukprot:Sro12_g009220.1 NLR family, CARD domain containing 3 (484) ;mRNA; r:40084-41535